MALFQSNKMTKANMYNGWIKRRAGFFVKLKFRLQPGWCIQVRRSFIWTELLFSAASVLVTHTKGQLLRKTNTQRWFASPFWRSINRIANVNVTKQTMQTAMLTNLNPYVIAFLFVCGKLSHKLTSVDRTHS